MKKNHLNIIGAPSSAGAYSPGQENTPDALRAAGLIQLLEHNGLQITDKNNVPGYRWSVDRANPRAMNVDKVERVAAAVSQKVSESLANDERIVVLGGDCTIELGSVAGCLQHSDKIGLIYIDMDTDLNTPKNVDDGTLDWMGVAHLLNLPGTEEKLTSLGKRKPMLKPEQIHFFANGSGTNFEREIIDNYKIKETSVQEVMADPQAAAKTICDTWAPQFHHVLIHLDADVLDYFSLPLAENYRRNQGLQFEQLMSSLQEFLRLPNWSVLTITEINPAHGEADGSTLRSFSESLAKILGTALNKR